MPEIIYTAGYSGHKPEDLKRIATALDAVIVDIRFHPFSRWHPQWRKVNMTALLGDRYQSVREWGNPNHGKDLPIVIDDFEHGWRIVRGIKRPVIALCACHSQAHCHRKVLASILTERGLCTVRELDWTVGAPVSSLFDISLMTKEQ